MRTLVPRIAYGGKILMTPKDLALVGHAVIGVLQVVLFFNTLYGEL